MGRGYGGPFSYQGPYGGGGYGAYSGVGGYGLGWWEE